MIVEIIRTEAIALQNQQVDYLLVPNAILLLLQDGTARLLNLDGEFYAISATGALILKETLKGGSTTAVNRLVAEYELDTTQALNDVLVFLQGLENKGVIYHPKDSSPQVKGIGFDLSLLTLPLLWLISSLPASLQIRTWLALALAYLSIRLFGLPGTIKAWQTPKRQASLIADNQEMTFLMKSVDLAVSEATACHLLKVECKERALCSWWLARFAGIPAQIKLGVYLFPFATHCWCEVSSEVIGDDKERCEHFTSVLTYE